jgi:hypothetical protein
MQLYEIRLLRDDRSTRFVLSQMHLDDHAAIRAASRLSKGAPFEVWRELECVFGLMSDNSTIAN